ncbi:Peroxidase 2 [Nymphaea thermarum]|nr:Peroxidase 2 [Nymphaea thermarum]
MAKISVVTTMVVVMGLVLAAGVNCQQLSPFFYFRTCPQALPAIRAAVFAAVAQEPRMGASLLRLHFHDCFVNGCDGSVLLDDTPTITGEKGSLANANSARGFEVIDSIKSAVDRACGGSVVSCADILAVAARDSVVALGGPSWPVQLGRRDSTTASKDAADTNLPSPFSSLATLISSFQRKGLNARDLVALSGAHTIGQAQCRVFRTRIYNDTNIDTQFASSLQGSCPASGGDSNLSPLDRFTPTRFDGAYFGNLMSRRGLLHSDQELFNNGTTDQIVRAYSFNPRLFSADFASAMVKMGNLSPLTGTNGQIRQNCRRVTNYKEKEIREFLSCFDKIHPSSTEC